MSNFPSAYIVCLDGPEWSSALHCTWRGRALVAREGSQLTHKSCQKLDGSAVFVRVGRRRWSRVAGKHDKLQPLVIAQEPQYDP